MSIELNLRFPDPQHVIVRCADLDLETGRLEFNAPLTPKERQDLAWYLETYSAGYTAEEDDREAARIAALLPEWGKKLFTAALSDPVAHTGFQDFLRTDENGRLLTISAEHPAILGLPWELLHNTGAGSAYLLDEQPRIAIRRRVAGSTGTRASYKPPLKDKLHLLFVVSRPSGAGFIDPRADAMAVLSAIEKYAPGRVTVEFLRPATFEGLVERLEDDNLPKVDILHFDGHGVFDGDGSLHKDAQGGANRLVGSANTHMREATQGSGTNMGYLLFEDKDGKNQLVPAAALGAQLHQSKIGLVVLSACQTAMVGSNDDAMGSVAARLTATGVPSVLAMSYSVLVPTTGRLFGKFYEQLARGRGVGEALERARNYLRLDPKRLEVQRGPVLHWLELQDWCVPSLYQPGTDGPLLSTSDIAPVETTAETVVFCGRSRELWNIERWFVGGARRVSISGFGGQGKTHLAQEAGRWLLRTGLFRRVAFVSFASFQGIDALGSAVSACAVALNETLIDAAALTASLQKTPTLLILDNLEDVPSDALAELLSAAKEWSEAGASRVLVTARPAELNHAAFALQNDARHRHLTLGGLSPDSALELYNAVLKLPPDATATPPSREALTHLFGRVDFHPLSIHLLSQQLKTRRIADVDSRLAELLLADTENDKDKSLRASLKLSLDKLSPEIRDKWLPRLGVFQGGAMEDSLLAITGLGKVDEDPENAKMRHLLTAYEKGDLQPMAHLIGSIVNETELPEEIELPQELLDQIAPLADEVAETIRADLANYPESAFAEGADETTWPQLKSALLAAALIELIDLAPVGVAVPFLKFHPTLAPTLWSTLAPEQHVSLSASHRRRYYSVSRELYILDGKNPYAARAIARRELPNLLHAVRGALEAGDQTAVEFADNVGRFLYVFGLKRDAADLNERSLRDESGWYLAQSNQGEQLLRNGNVQMAAEVFNTILQRLGDEPTYRRCVTLQRLGRCFGAQGQSDLASQCYNNALNEADKLEQSDGVKRQRSTLQADLGDVLTAMGQYAEARTAYEKSLVFGQESGDLRQAGVANGQLGLLAIQEGNLLEAANRYNEALKLFQQLIEPASEAVVLHQLGLVFQKAQQWDEAERCYRESARIEESQGNLSGAASTWNQLARVNESTGKLQAAEDWYRKALNAFKQGDERVGISKTLNNLAALLQRQPLRLVEAQQLAEEALVIKKTLDPSAAEIWKNYATLGEIADKQHGSAQAREYRRLAREAYRNFAGSQHQIQKFAPLIEAVVAAVAQPQLRGDLGAALVVLENRGYNSLVAAINRILDSERDVEALCEPLDFEDSFVVETILMKLPEYRQPRRGL